MDAGRGVDFVELLRTVPERLEAAGSAQLRYGLAGRPLDSEAVCDFRRRITVAHTLVASPWVRETLETGDLVARALDRLVDRWHLDQPHTFVYAGGAVFIQGSRRVLGDEAPAHDAPRNRADPTWTLDLLWGVVEPVRVVAQDPDGVVHLAASCDIALADDRCPYGVRHPSEGPEKDWATFEVEIWLNSIHLPIRVNQKCVSPGRARRVLLANYLPRK